MRAVFTHKNSFDFICSENPIPRALFILGPLAWKRWYPEDIVVLYVDLETKTYLDSIPKEFRGWSEINVLDFNQISYFHDERMWCWPRLYTALLEKEPCIISDIDVVLCGKFKPEDTGGFWGTTHYFESNSQKIIGSCNILKGVLCEKYVCGGLVYHPNIDMLHELAQNILDFQKIGTVDSLIRREGYSDYACIFEQGYPVSFYRNYKIKECRFEQTNNLCEILSGNCKVYHAMADKYLRDVSKQSQILQVIFKVALNFSKEDAESFCRSVGCSDELILKIISRKENALLV